MGAALAFGAVSCGQGGCGDPTPGVLPPKSVRLSWDGDADLDMEIWNGEGSRYLFDAAGDSPALDGDGVARREESWTIPPSTRDTAVVVAVRGWTFRNDQSVHATVEMEGVRVESTLSEDTPTWKALRWNGLEGRAETIPVP